MGAYGHNGKVMPHGTNPSWYHLPISLAGWGAWTPLMQELGVPYNHKGLPYSYKGLPPPFSSSRQGAQAPKAPLPQPLPI